MSQSRYDASGKIRVDLNTYLVGLPVSIFLNGLTIGNFILPSNPVILGVVTLA